MPQYLCYLSGLRRSLLGTAPSVTQTRPFSSQTCKRGQNPTIDFPTIEAKWQAKWDNREDRIPQDASVCHNPPLLSPFYLPHLRKPTTILETLQWHYGRAGARFTDRKRAVLDSVLELSLSKSTERDAYIQSFGADIVRTFLVFRNPAFEGDEIYKEELERTRNWLGSVWEAVLSAHGSYISTQSCPACPNVPEALYEPNLGSWLDYINNEHFQWVQVPPEEPERPSPSADWNEYHLWFTTQKAIHAYTTPITRRNSLPAIRTRLVRLTKAISDYGEADLVSCDMHYYSACVLLSLLAPSAPAFAEECWVLLHYGGEQGMDGESEERDGFDEDIIREAIKETEDLLERRHLPRQGRPDTLKSIFDQPFPVVKERLTLQKKDSSG